jgi:hypothetical protein
MRFPFTILFIIGIAVLSFMEVNKVKFEIQERLWAFFILGAFLNIGVTLYLEEFQNRLYRYALNLIPVILLTIYCFTLPDDLVDYQTIQLVTMGVVFILSAFVVSFLKKDNDIPFWNFSRESIVQLFISYFFASVLVGGISLALLSLDKLFNVNIVSKVYQNLSIICYLLFAPVYFLSNLPDEFEKRKQDISFPKIFKIFGLYILLPILSVYVLILYVYLFQIIIKWELPNGWVSTLVSVLGLGGFLCMLVLHPLHLKKENKIAEMFSKYFPLVLFPLLVLMSVGILRRVSDYGLTINRCYVLLLNVWMYGISHYLFYSKAKHLKWIIISFALVLFLSSVGPWSVFSITRHSLTNKLEKLFVESNVLKDGKLPLVVDIALQVDSTSQLEIIETIRYLHKNFGNESLQPFFQTSLENVSLSKIFAGLNLKDQLSSPDLEYFSAYLPAGFFIDINEYQYMLDISISENNTKIYKDENITVTLNGNQLNLQQLKPKAGELIIPIEPLIKQLMVENQKNKEKEYSKKELTISGEDYQFVIYSISVQYDEAINEYKINNLDAHLFYRIP